MSGIVKDADLALIIEALRLRLLALPLTDVRITTLGKRLFVDARFYDTLMIRKVRSCCDEVSEQTGIPISVTCTLS